MGYWLAVYQGWGVGMVCMYSIFRLAVLFVPDSPPIILLAMATYIKMAILLFIDILHYYLTALFNGLISKYVYGYVNILCAYSSRIPV